MTRHALHDAIRFREPPLLPLPMPRLPPLNCRRCGEEVLFPNGKLRACRCDRRLNWSLVLLPLAFVVAFLVLR